MNKDRIEALLRSLGERLRVRGIQGEVFVVGGSAMAMAYSARRTTDDIDAIIRPRDEVLTEAAAMAVEAGLDPSWLNDAVVDYLPPRPDDAAITKGPYGGLRISVASARYLLAMKCMASRQSPGDLEDAALLARRLGIESERELESIVTDYFGTSQIGAQELWLEDVVERSRTIAVSVGTDIGSRGATAAGTCGQWMPRARRRCSLPSGHSGQHR